MVGQGSGRPPAPRLRAACRPRRWCRRCPQCSREHRREYQRLQARRSRASLPTPATSLKQELT